MHRKQDIFTLPTGRFSSYRGVDRCTDVSQLECFLFKFFRQYLSGICPYLFLKVSIKMQFDCSLFGPRVSRHDVRKPYFQSTVFSFAKAMLFPLDRTSHLTYISICDGVSGWVLSRNFVFSACSCYSVFVVKKKILHQLRQKVKVQVCWQFIVIYATIKHKWAQNA